MLKCKVVKVDASDPEKTEQVINEALTELKNRAGAKHLRIVSVSQGHICQPWSTNPETVFIMYRTEKEASP